MKYAAPLKWLHLKEVQVKNNFVWAHASIDFSLQAMQCSVYLSQFNLHPQAAEDQHSILSQLAGLSKKPPGEPSACLAPALQGRAWQQDLGPTLLLKDGAERKGALKLSLTQSRVSQSSGKACSGFPRETKILIFVG